MAVNTTVEVVMPAMGDSVSEGTVLEWHKQEGDSISADETLVEISTDKVDAEVPSPATGTIVKIHAAEGDTIEVGSLLAEISTDGGAPAAAAPEGNGTANGSATAEAPAEPVAAPAAEAPAAESTDVEITMPQMGESVTEGVILEWLKQPGDAIEADETIVEISTDKVDAEVPSPAAGTMGEILAQAGDTVTVGQVIARMSAGGPVSAPAPEVTDTRPGTDAPSPAPAAPVDVPDGTRVSPVARRVAAAHGVDLAGVQTPSGRITKADVLAAAEGNGASAAPAAPAAKPAGAQLIKGASAMLARYMDESRSIPTATSFRTLTVTTLDGRRKELKAGGHKVSFTHLIAYAIAKAATEQMPVMAP
ncbi:MAG: Dihydrolipoamide succinyltransferase component (E2) of 2-oxoglutarate dehydrogenase complex / 2-oxoglutarate dehydrogenase E1 component, partial [uncultured Solirubrobacteraceae bacterium]